MYNDFKNDFISDLSTMNINLNKDQMNTILSVLDGTANKYDILNRCNVNRAMAPNGVPQSVYDYIQCKKAEGLTKETLYIYKTVLEIFFKTVQKPPEYIEAQDIMNWLRDYQATHDIGNRTLDKYRQYICCYFVFIHDYGYIQRNPSRQVKKIKWTSKPLPILDEYEMELIRGACITKRERAIVEFLFSTACRVGELTKVKKKDINWNTDEVLLFGKGSKYGISFITARCKYAIEQYLEVRDEIEDSEDSEYLFIADRYPYRSLTVRGVQDIIERIMARIPQIHKRFTPHRFRASTSTNAYLNGMSLEDIRMFLRHADIKTTEIYVQNSVQHVHGEHKKYVH